MALIKGLLAVAWCCPSPASSVERPLEAITFAIEPGKIYVPMNEAIKELDWATELDSKGRCVRLNKVALDAGSLRRLTDGTELVSADDLQRAGATSSVNPADGSVTVTHGRHQLRLVVGSKRVEVSLVRQQLHAWQGTRLVMQSRISSGRRGNTPAGDFAAGPYKARMHYSSLFNNAPMPWSVQIYKHVFIHGFTSVPNYPASHGCIRLPLDEGNPARFLFEWIDVGTPVHVTRD